MLTDVLDLKQVRLDLGGITQAELADLVGVTKWSVSAWEQNRWPVPASVKKLIGLMLAAHKVAA